MSLTIADVRAAAQRLAGVAHRTPVVRSRTLDALTDAEVFVKCENFQRMGAFKFRGAYNLLASLSPGERAGGVVAFSSGNHAQGVALAARMLGISATIVMPSDAPAVKLAATRAYGAQSCSTNASARTVKRSHAASPPSGARRSSRRSTIRASSPVRERPRSNYRRSGEARRDRRTGRRRRPDGRHRARRTWHRSEAFAIYGVEPEAGDDFARSLARRRAHHDSGPAHHCRRIANDLARHCDVRDRATACCAASLRVSDGELRDAMRFAFERMKMVVEPSGAAPLAALLQRRIPELCGMRVGTIVSGGNVDAARFAQLLSP